MNDFSFNYSNFISHVKNVFTNNTFLENILNETIEQQLSRVKNFNDSLNTTTLFNCFLENKIKLFSHKKSDTLIVSESMFGTNVPLKKIFNNQDDTVKALFWLDLHHLLLAYNNCILLTDPNNQEILNRIHKLEQKRMFNPKDGLTKILNTEKLNTTTNNMINDIFTTFEKTTSNAGSSPFANIMQISEMIGTKYQSEIENGEVNLDDLLSSMTGLPGMENIGGLLSSFSDQKTPEKVIIDENFSTAIVPKGEQKDETSNINIGGLLNTINSMGVFGGDSDENGMGKLMDVFGGNSDENGIGKLMDVFGKLSSTTEPSQINSIMENDFGIDMAKFTEEMSQALK